MTADGVRWDPAALSAFADAVACLHTTYFRGGAADPRVFLARTTTSAAQPATSDHTMAAHSAPPTPEAITALQDAHENICQQFAARLTALSEALVDLAERAHASSRAITAADRTAAARLARLRRPTPAATVASPPQRGATPDTGWPPATLDSAATGQPGPQLLPPHTSPVGRNIDPSRPAAPPPPAAVTAAITPGLTTKSRPPLTWHTPAHPAAAPLDTSPPHPAEPRPPAGHPAAHPSLPAPNTDAADPPSTPPFPAAAVIPTTLAAAAASAAACDPGQAEPQRRSHPTAASSAVTPGTTAREALPSAEQPLRGTGSPPPAGHPARRRPHQQRRASAHTPTATPITRFAGPPSTPDGRNTAPQARPTERRAEAAPPPDPDARLTALADEFPAARAALLAARHLLATRS